MSMVGKPSRQLAADGGAAVRVSTWIWVESKVGEGSEFHFTIPLAAA